MNSPFQNPPPREQLAISVEQFAAIIGVSKSSGWTIIQNEARRAAVNGCRSRLPVISPIEGGHIKRLLMRDVESWLDELRKAA